MGSFKKRIIWLGDSMGYSMQNKVGPSWSRSNPNTSHSGRGTLSYNLFYSPVWHTPTTKPIGYPRASQAETKSFPHRWNLAFYINRVTLRRRRLKIDEIDTLFKTKSSENHTLSGRTSPLRPDNGVRTPPPPDKIPVTSYIDVTSYKIS